MANTVKVTLSTGKLVEYKDAEAGPADGFLIVKKSDTVAILYPASELKRVEIERDAP